jgi:Ca2+-binding EF-hand superfamily protein
VYLNCSLLKAEKLKMKFSAAFDSNADGKITLEEAQSALKTLGISLEDALVTEIKDIIFDSKLAILDLYTALDLNKDMVVTINELFHGLLNLTESIGVTLKPEMKQTLLNIADIIQVDKTGELELPKGKPKVLTKNMQNLLKLNFKLRMYFKL